MSNSMLCINVYRHNGCWCFDDTTRELLAEPFVLGMSEIISSIIEEQQLPSAKFYKILFADTEFPTAQGSLVRNEFDTGGAWYYREAPESLPEASTKVQQGWLCPATLKYFEVHPPKIFFKIEQASLN